MIYPKPGMTVDVHGIEATVRRVLPMSLFLHGFKRPFHHGEWMWEKITEREECERENRRLIVCSCGKIDISQGPLQYTHKACGKCFEEHIEWVKIKEQR